MNTVLDLTCGMYRIVVQTDAEGMWETWTNFGYVAMHDNLLDGIRMAIMAAGWEINRWMTRSALSPELGYLVEIHGTLIRFGRWVAYRRCDV